MGNQEEGWGGGAAEYHQSRMGLLPLGLHLKLGRALVPTAGLPEQCMCRVQLTFAPAPPHSGHPPFPWVLTNVPAQPDEGPSAPLGLGHPPFIPPGDDPQGLPAKPSYQVPRKVLEVSPSFIPLTNPP